MSDKEKIELEYIIKTSSKILYNMISTPSGLSEWFADDVNIKDDIYTFFWNGSEEAARLINNTKPQYVRFRWLEQEEEGEDTYFELRIKIDPLTKDVALIVTDFAEEDEKEDTAMLWDEQVNALKHVLGG